jgi:D-amino-acid dehydrogenase
MRVLVLGAGVVGVTAAWYLSQDGHEVTVLDRHPGAALETSFANGGQISASYAEPWANPEAPLKILKWLGRDDAPLLFRLRADLQQWRWGLQFLRVSLRARHNTIQCLNLALYGDCLNLRADRHEYDHPTRILSFTPMRRNSRKALRPPSDAHVRLRPRRENGYGVRCHQPALASCRERLAASSRCPTSPATQRFTRSWRAWRRARGEIRDGGRISSRKRMR